MKDKLKSCPFCGGKEIITGAFDYCNDAHVNCGTCGANFEIEVPWDNMTGEEHDTRCYDLLKDLWNARPD